MQHPSYSSANGSSAAVHSNSSAEEDFITSSESSSSEVTPCNSCFLLYSDPLESDLLGLEGSCCCVSTEELAADFLDQPLVGWGKRVSTIACPKVNSCHHASSVASLVSEKTLGSGVTVENSSHNLKESSPINLARSSMSRAMINLGLESKSSLRSYIHSTPAIPYTFHHHVNGDMAIYMEEYRNSYTFPSIEEKIRKMSSNSQSLTAPVKPTLFVLENYRSPTTSQEKQVLLCQSL